MADAGDGVAIYVGSGAAILGYGPLPSARVAMDWQSGAMGIRASSTHYLGSDVERLDVLGGSWALGTGNWCLGLGSRTLVAAVALGWALPVGVRGLARSCN